MGVTEDRDFSLLKVKAAAALASRTARIAEASAGAPRVCSMVSRWENWSPYSGCLLLIRLAAEGIANDGKTERA